MAVDVIDAKTAAFSGQISVSPPFAGVVTTADCNARGGTTCSGPNGVVAASPWLFVTDGGSRVVNIDLRTGTIAPGGDVVTAANDPNRADELAYAPELGLLLVINNADAIPFGTFISVDQTTGALTVGTRITFTAATNGAEQPVWDPGTRRFYLSIPEINGNQTNQHGAVLRISTTGEVEATYPVDFCGPAGLALGPNGDLLVGCNSVFDTAGGRWTGNADRDTNTAAPQYVILNAKTGNINNVLGVGAGDEVWFNKGDGHYYTASSGSPLAPNAITPARPPVGTATTAPVLTAQGAAILGVIDAFSKTLDQLVPTFNVPAVGTGNNSTEHPAAAAHSVAANAKNNLVFVPLGANNVFPDCLTGCIAVYGRSDNDKD